MKKSFTESLSFAHLGQVRRRLLLRCDRGRGQGPYLCIQRILYVYEKQIRGPWHFDSLLCRRVRSYRAVLGWWETQCHCYIVFSNLHYHLTFCANVAFTFCSIIFLYTCPANLSHSVILAFADSDLDAPFRVSLFFYSYLFIYLIVPFFQISVVKF